MKFEEWVYGKRGDFRFVFILVVGVSRCRGIGMRCVWGCGLFEGWWGGFEGERVLEFDLLVFWGLCGTG